MDHPSIEASGLEAPSVNRPSTEAPSVEATSTQAPTDKAPSVDVVSDTATVPKPPSPKEVSTVSSTNPTVSDPSLNQPSTAPAISTVLDPSQLKHLTIKVNEADPSSLKLPAKEAIDPSSLKRSPTAGWEGFLKEQVNVFKPLKGVQKLPGSLYTMPDGVRVALPVPHHKQPPYIRYTTDAGVLNWVCTQCRSDISPTFALDIPVVGQLAEEEEGNPDVDGPLDEEVIEEEGHNIEEGAPPNGANEEDNLDEGVLIAGDEEVLHSTDDKPADEDDAMDNADDDTDDDVFTTAKTSTNKSSSLNAKVAAVESEQDMGE